MNIYYFLVIAGIFACSCSQLLLKQSALRKHRNFVASMLNWRVIAAYLIFFCSLLINITAMSRGVNLKDLPILESLGYVFVPLLSFLFLKEKISKSMILATFLILIGIFIFYN